MSSAPRVLAAGGGMITADLLLPSLYHLQRLGEVGGITICARRPTTLRSLAEDARLRPAFPGQSFTPRVSADAFRAALAELPARQIVVVATPDPVHFEMVMQALRADQHVLCVKPLVLRQEEAAQIHREARRRALFVGVEYHKRFDRRSLVARGDYRSGKFGELRFGEARLIEPYSYRRSNFQSWFTADATDPFTYVGCHYVDLVHFITGLRPTEVAVSGVPGAFPSGTEGLMWSLATVRWENGALLSVANGLGYPDKAAGSNDQGMVLYCEGPGASGMIRHDDHDRGVSYSYLQEMNEGGSHFNYVSPDFFQLVPWEGEGLRPVGYGFDSVAALVSAVRRVESAGPEARGRLLQQIDDEGLLATPANSSADTLALEAGRLSLGHGGRPVRIEHHGDGGRAVP